MSKTSTLVLGPATMTITRDNVLNNIADVIPKASITGVSGVYNKKPANGEISYSAASGTYTIGETITGGTSGATAILVGFKGTTVLILKSISGTFVAAEVLTGGTSLVTSNSTSVITDLSYTGEWGYTRDVMTIVQVERVDGSRLNIELQDISNQGTWSTGTQAGLQQAIADINAWL